MKHTPDGSERGSSLGKAGGDGSETVFDLLADPRRRIVLQYLAERDGAATIDELAAAIARRETDSGRQAISDHGGVQSSDLERIRIALHHVHLPKLAAAEAVDFDGRENTVAIRDSGLNLVARTDAILSEPLDW